MALVCAHVANKTRLSSLKTLAISLSTSTSEVLRRAQEHSFAFHEPFLHQSSCILNIRKSKVGIMVKDQVKIKDMRDVIERVKESAFYADTLPDKIKAGFLTSRSCSRPSSLNQSEGKVLLNA
jgi:hypothetical protein